MKKVILTSLVVLLIIAGALVVKQYINTGSNTPDSNIQGNLNPADSNNKQKEVKLYYANKKYVETGDESQPKVIAINKKISYGKISLEEAAIRELRKAPADAPNLGTEIPEDAILLGVEVKEGAATVNFASEGLNGGSLEEMLTIDQIVSTLLDMEGINSVQFLKDGKQAEDLMGHADISEPFYKKKEIKVSELQLGEMKLYMKKDEFINKFGKPTAVRKDKTGKVEYLTYPEYNIIVINGEVSEISTTSNKFATPSGLRVGDTQKKAMDIYGEPSSISRGTLNYKVGSLYELLHIKVKDEKVTEIRINLAD